MKKLYRIVVRKTSYHYVRCTAEEMGRWLSMLNLSGEGNEVSVTEINLSDLDEINHLYFC
ncbi:hypothetical protein LCGC14_2264390 [marine sediment metagenome]|uniref:Uncharacterized protein n=1 Tax=marine sediment metagenome TaxID=412755 RepID=A0A0F9FB63_9ZZZZ